MRAGLLRWTRQSSPCCRFNIFTHIKSYSTFKYDCTEGKVWQMGSKEEESDAGGRVGNWGVLRMNDKKVTCNRLHRNSLDMRMLIDLENLLLKFLRCNRKKMQSSGNSDQTTVWNQRKASNCSFIYLHFLYGILPIYTLKYTHVDTNTHVKYKEMSSNNPREQLMQLWNYQIWK